MLARGVSSSVIIQYGTQAELAEETRDYCPPLPAGNKTITGTAAGLTPSDFAIINFGGSSATAISTMPGLTFTGVADGLQDVVGYRHLLSGPAFTDRAFLRRDQNIPDGGSLGTIDFNGPESFVPAAATITVVGSSAGDAIATNMFLFTGASCRGGGELYLANEPAATFPGYGIPATLLRPTDVHALHTVVTRGNSGRVDWQSFHTLTDRTVTLGAPLSAAVTALSGPYKRLQAVFTIPSDYQTAAVLTFSDLAHFVSITGSVASFGGSTPTLTMPDLTGLPGWSNAWMPSAATTTNWQVLAYGTNITASGACVEGNYTRNATVNGTL